MCVYPQCLTAVCVYDSHMSEQMETEADILRALEEAEKSREWVSKNYDQLRTKYQGKVFAVKDEQIVASRDSITELVDEVKDRKDSAHILIESIPPKGIVFIL